MRCKLFPKIKLFSVHEWSEAMKMSVFADSEHKRPLDGDKNQVAIGERVYVSIEPSSPLPDTVSFYVRECISSESTVRRFKVKVIDQYECKRKGSKLLAIELLAM